MTITKTADTRVLHRSGAATGALVAAGIALVAAAGAYAATARLSAIGVGLVVALALVSLPAVRRAAPIAFTTVIAALWFIAAGVVLVASIGTGRMLIAMLAVPCIVVGVLLVRALRR